MELKESKTAQNLKDAFAGESQANRRYLYFAQKADIEGAPDVAGVFRSTAEGETGHAHGHLEYLEEVGDPATGEAMGETEDNLKSAIKSITASSLAPVSTLSNTSDKKFCMYAGVSERFKSNPIAFILSTGSPSRSYIFIAYLFLVMNNPLDPTASLPAAISLPYDEGQLKD